MLAVHKALDYVMAESTSLQSWWPMSHRELAAAGRHSSFLQSTCANALWGALCIGYCSVARLQSCADWDELLLSLPTF